MSDVSKQPARGRLAFLCFLQRGLPERPELPGAPAGVRVSVLPADRQRYAELVEQLMVPHLVVEARLAGVHACGVFVRARALAHVQWDLPAAATPEQVRAAWRLVAQLSARGAGLGVLDAVALRWHAVRDLPALGGAQPDAPGDDDGLDLGRELKLEPWSHEAPLVDPAARPACVRTRGLAKFDQPELLLSDPLGVLGNLEAARSFLLGLADQLVSGQRAEAGQVVHLPGWRVDLARPWGLLPERQALTHRDVLLARLTPQETVAAPPARRRLRVRRPASARLARMRR